MPPELTSPLAASTGTRDLTLRLTPASLVTAGGGGPRASKAGGRLGMCLHGGLPRMLDTWGALIGVLSGLADAVAH